MGKIVFIDVDGTLVNYSGHIPESAVTAVQQAREAGHLVIPVTGRSKSEGFREIAGIGIDGFIGGNGSYVELNDSVIFEQTLSLAECSAVVDWLNDRGIDFYLEANSGLYGSTNFADGALPAIRAYSAGKGMGDVAALTTNSIFPDMIYDADLYRDDVNKISFVLRDYQDFLAAKVAFPHLKAGTWGGRGSSALFGDFGVADIDKANAIGILLNHIGADRADTIAIGDAAVDIPMMEYCGQAVAMGNSPDEVKAIADYITTDVDRDGLANAFQYLELR